MSKSEAPPSTQLAPAWMAWSLSIDVGGSLGVGEGHCFYRLCLRPLAEPRFWARPWALSWRPGDRSNSDVDLGPASEVGGQAPKSRKFWADCNQGSEEGAEVQQKSKNQNSIT